MSLHCGRMTGAAVPTRAGCCAVGPGGCWDPTCMAEGSSFPTMLQTLPHFWKGKMLTLLRDHLRSEWFIDLVLKQNILIICKSL